METDSEWMVDELRFNILDRVRQWLVSERIRVHIAFPQ